jgi:hypothetical protein
MKITKGQYRESSVKSELSCELYRKSTYKLSVKYSYLIRKRCFFTSKTTLKTPENKLFSPQMATFRAKRSDLKTVKILRRNYFRIKHIQVVGLNH